MDEVISDLLSNIKEAKTRKKAIIELLKFKSEFLLETEYEDVRYVYKKMEFLDHLLNNEIFRNNLELLNGESDDEFIIILFELNKILIYIEENINVVNNKTDAIIEILKLEKFFPKVNDKNRKNISLIHSILKNNKITQNMNLIYNDIDQNDQGFLNVIINKYMIHIQKTKNYDKLVNYTTIEKYYSSICEIYPICDKYDNDYLLRKYKKTNSKKLKEYIMCSNMRLVIKHVNTDNYNSNNKEELIQEAIIGLYEAIDRYKLEETSSFSSYAMYWLKVFIYKHLRISNSLLLLPGNLQSKLLSYKKAINELTIINNESLVSDEEVAKYMNTSLKNVLFYKELAMKTSVTSLDKQKLMEENDEKIIDMAIEESFEDDLINALDEDLLVKIMNKLLNKLEINIICRRYGLYTDKTESLEQIGDSFGISRERINQLEKAALAKIKQYYENPKSIRVKPELYNLLIEEKLVINNLYRYFEFEGGILTSINSKKKETLIKYLEETIGTRKTGIFIDKSNIFSIKKPSVPEISRKYKLIKHELEDIMKLCINIINDDLEERRSNNIKSNVPVVIDTDKGFIYRELESIMISEGVINNSEELLNNPNVLNILRTNLTPYFSEVIIKKIGLDGSVPFTDREVTEKFGLKKGIIRSTMRRGLKLLIKALNEGSVDKISNSNRLQNALISCNVISEGESVYNNPKVITYFNSILSEQDRALILTMCGYYGENSYTEKELAKMFSLSLSNIYNIKLKVLARMYDLSVKNEKMNLEIVDLHSIGIEDLNNDKNIIINYLYYIVNNITTYDYLTKQSLINLLNNISFEQDVYDDNNVTTKNIINEFEIIARNTFVNIFKNYLSKSKEISCVIQLSIINKLIEYLDDEEKNIMYYIINGEDIEDIKSKLSINKKKILFTQDKIDNYMNSYNKRLLDEIFEVLHNKQNVRTRK